MKIFFDGGCRPNPGRMEVAVVARGRTYHQPDVGNGDNNQAEWHALLHALSIARTLDVDDIVALGDSSLVVNQANREWKCRSPELAALLARFEAARGDFARVRVRLIRRTQNLAGIALASRAAPSGGFAKACAPR